MKGSRALRGKFSTPNMYLMHARRFLCQLGGHLKGVLYERWDQFNLDNAIFAAW